jgi:hypothetical protein
VPPRVGEETDSWWDVVPRALIIRSLRISSGSRAKGGAVLFVGVDWAEDHHDACVMAEDGAVLGKRRVSDSVAGIGELHVRGSR